MSNQAYNRVKQSLTFKKNRSWGDEVDLHPLIMTTKYIKAATVNAKGNSLKEDYSILKYSR
jgi:hypothetical protein